MDDKVLFPFHPDYLEKNGPKFMELYRLAHEVECPVFGHGLSPIILNRYSPIKCAFCGKTEKETSFEEVAHTIPIALGNRHHLTKEECDECNRYYGSRYDQELANWLKPERAIHRIRRRPGEGPPTLEGPNDTTLHIDGRTGGFVLTGDGINFEQLIDRDKKEIAFSYFRPSIDKVAGLRAIVRIGWQLITPSEREAHPNLLSLIKNEVRDLAWEYWHIDTGSKAIPGTRFEVWMSKGSQQNIPSIIFRLRLGNLIFVWTEPDWKTGKTIPSPLPPISGVSNDLIPSMKGTLISLQENHVTPSSEEKITFGYETLTKGPSALPDRPQPKPVQESMKVRLGMSGSRKHDLETFCYLRYLADGTIKVYIAGGELGAKFELETKQGVSGNGESKLRLEDTSVKHAIATVKLFEEVKRSGEELIGFLPDGSAKFSIAGMELPSGYSALKLIDALERIDTVNNFFGTDIRFSSEVTVEDFNDLTVLSEAIRNKGKVEVSFLNSTLSASASRSRAIELLARIEKEGPSLIAVEQLTIYNLWGNALSPVRRKLELPAAFVETEHLRNQIESSAPDDTILVKFKSEKVKYTFPEMIFP